MSKSPISVAQFVLALILIFAMVPACRAAPAEDPWQPGYALEG